MTEQICALCGMTFVELMIIKTLIAIGGGMLVLFVCGVTAEAIRRIKTYFARRCPKCRTIHKISDKYCRMCGYELGGFSSWTKREREKNCQNTD